MKSKEEVLTSMGYRKVDNNWMKPFGKNLLIYESKENTIINIFRDKQNKVIPWNREKFVDGGDFLDFIQAFECNTRIDTRVYLSGLEFMRVEDHLNLM